MISYVYDFVYVYDILWYFIYMISSTYFISCSMKYNLQSYMKSYTHDIIYI